MSAEYVSRQVLLEHNHSAIAQNVEHHMKTSIRGNGRDWYWLKSQDVILPVYIKQLITIYLNRNNYLYCLKDIDSIYGLLVIYSYPS